MRQNPVGEPREWQDDTDRSNDEASLACAMFWKDAFVEPPITFALQDNSSTLGPVPRWPEIRLPARYDASEGLVPGRTPRIGSVLAADTDAAQVAQQSESLQ